MNKKWNTVYKRAAERLDGLVWDNGMVRHEGPGHTKGAQVPVTHSGRETVECYVLGRAVSKISKEEGLRILKALRELQVTSGMENPDALPKLDPGSQLGAFRWYREEDRIWDTNAAFFICMPMILHRLLASGIFSSEETEIIDMMLELAGNWFHHECLHASYYYSNKTLSDGAALSSIGYIVGNDEYQRVARDYFDRWLDYTEKRGWGWGENTSLGYNGVIFPALRVAELTIGSEKLVKKIKGVIENQKKFFRFYDGHEVCPSIRTYNYEGLSERPSLVYNLAGVRGSGLDKLAQASDIFCAFADELYETDEELIASASYQQVETPRQMTTRIFDQTYAYSWYGVNGGIGTLNAFPVISGIDRNATWGLGWQSQPVSYVVYGEQTSYLRFYVNDGEMIRAHPKRNYLTPRLFSEMILPRITTCSAQNGPLAISIRAIDRLHNRAQEIADEYYVNNFKGAVVCYKAKGREFLVLQYEKATVIIAALNGIVYGEGRAQRKMVISHEKNNLLRIRQIMYAGKLQTLLQERVEAAWLTIYKDCVMNESEIREYINKLEIEDRSWTNGEEPRDEWAQLRTICVSDGEYNAKLEYDPYRFPGGQH